MPVHNEDLAAAFDEMADLLSLKEKNPFRTNAYRRASQVVRSLPEEFQGKIAAGFDPDTLPGIGADLADKIRAFVKTGELPGLATLRRSIPPGLRKRTDAFCRDPEERPAGRCPVSAIGELRRCALLLHRQQGAQRSRAPACNGAKAKGQ